MLSTFFDVLFFADASDYCIHQTYNRRSFEVISEKFDKIIHEVIEVNKGDSIKKIHQLLYDVIHVLD